MMVADRVLSLLNESVTVKRELADKNSGIQLAALNARIELKKLIGVI